MSDKPVEFYAIHILGFGLWFGLFYHIN